MKHQNNSKKTWEVLKEAIGRTQLKSNDFPRKLLINKNEIYDRDIMANSFNDYFVNVGSNLAGKIPSSEKHFSDYLTQTEHVLIEQELTLKEFEEAYSTLQRNKASGFDDINSNVIKLTCNELTIPLFHICKLSVKTGCFPEKMKIAKVRPLFKSGGNDQLNNYRPISVLPVFSKILERIMYNKLYSHISENNLLYEKQFGFQKKCSTDFAILQLAKEIHESFEKNKFMLGVFVDLSKAFDTVNHDILLTKLSYLGITGNYLKWLGSYLSNRKQYVPYDNDRKSNIQNILCGVPQGSILGPLLFLLYVNDLHKASNLIKPIMFADDTNFFHSDKNIKNLFQIFNKELQIIQSWFNANKLSLNTTKTKYTFFHSASYKDRIPLRLPRLEINSSIIKRESKISFLGVLLDENLTWKDHINCINAKVSKNIGLLYKARFLLDEKCSKQLYFSFIYSYLNYANIAWASTHKSKLKGLLRKQKHASRIIYFKDKYTHAKPLMQKMKSLNIYQLNIYQILLFMHKVKNNNIPNIFKNSFQLNNNKYNTKSSQTTFYKPFCKTTFAQFAISFRGPHMWNVLIPTTPQDASFSIFKSKVKQICLQLSETDRHTLNLLNHFNKHIIFV